MARFNWLQVSAGFAPQNDLSTPNDTLNDYRIFPCAVDGVPSVGRQSEEMRRKTGQYGAQSAPLPGGRDGATFTIRAPVLLGLLTFNPATATWQTGDQASPIQVLVANALGSYAENIASASDFLQGLGMWPGPYAAGGVASAASTSVFTVKNPTPGGAAFDPGAFVATVDDPDDPSRIQSGFIKSISGDAITLFEPSVDQAQADDDILPTWTIALTREEQLPETWRFWGIDSAQLIQMVGCVATEVRIMGAPGKTPEVEIDYIATDYQWLDTGGGLQIPSDLWQYALPVTGESGARTTFDGAALCGMEEWMLTVTCEVQARQCASGLQGVSSRDTVDRTAVLSFQIPEDTARAPDGATSESYWGTMFAQSTKHSLGFQCGGIPGQILAILMPRAHLSTPPTVAERNNALYWTLSWRADTYTADGGTTAPADTILRLGGA